MSSLRKTSLLLAMLWSNAFGRSLHMLTYRPATPEDAPALARIYNQSVADGRITADTAAVSEQSRVAWLADKHSRPERPCLMLLLGGAKIGYATLADFYGRPAYSITAEVGIYLDATVWHKGLGTAALAHLTKLAPELGIETLLAFVFDTNTASQKLFAKCGYELYGKVPAAARMPDGTHRTLEIFGKKV